MNFNVLRHPRPGLAEVQCCRLKFEPGDRVIVRVFEKISDDQRKKLRRTVEKWAGVDIEVLIVDNTRMDVTIEKAVPLHGRRERLS